jgi:hypothetical protein
MLQNALWDQPALEAEQIDYDANLNNTNLNPLVKQPPLSSCEVCVIIPVRNEAENLETTLLALKDQIDLESKPLEKNRYEIIVLANNCSDNSAQIALNFARNQPDLALHVVEITLEPDRAHIGWARKIVMDEAYRRLKSIGRDFGVIASTDGDTKVSPTWIAATLAEIQSGADAVGGRIITDPQEKSALDRVTRLYFLRSVCYDYLISQLETYLDPDASEGKPRHYQHFGASFAVTAQIYGKVGGLPPLPSSEDVALYNALMRIDARFRHSLTVRVTTSARVLGRAKAGLADRLAELTMMGAKQRSQFVESASVIEARLHLRRQLRHLWQRKQQGKAISAEGLIIAPQLLGISSDLLLEIVIRSSTFGLVMERIGNYQQNNHKLDFHGQAVTIQTAIRDLRAMISKISRVNYHFGQQQSEYLLNSNLNLNSLKQIEPIFLLPQSF